MKRLILCGVLTIAMAAAASAQVSFRAIDTLYVRTENSQDSPVRLRFGVDPEFTDTIDFKGPEFEIPGPPPAFYAAFLYLPPDQGTNRPYINADYRGVPDSIANATSRRAEVRYLFEVFTNFAEGRKPILGFARALTTGIDSIRVTDAVTDGFVVNHTFKREGGSFTVENEGVNRLYMRVYFNLDVSRVIAGEARGREALELGISPNPIRGSGRVAVRQSVPAGSRLMVTDMRGEQRELLRTAEEQAGLQIDLPGLASGVYMVRLVAADGTLLRSGRLVCID